MSAYTKTQGQPPQVKNTCQKAAFAALYIRLSKSDGDNDESDSIINQKRILSRFVDNHPEIQRSEYYVDDGWSGASFNRPGFLRMLSDIYARKVNIVIVKDSSRFGRAVSETDNYIMRLFPKLGVRYISVTESIDLGIKRSGSADFLNITMRSMINEYYVAENSDKIRATLNMKKERGEFIGAFAKYGYKKSPLNHNKLVVDKEAAEIVRSIFRMYLNGTGISGIVRYLNDSGIPNPSTYKQQKGMNYRSRTVGASSLWSDKTIRRTLRDEGYTGVMIQNKFCKVTYKDKSIRACDESEWVRVEGTHEPIISRDDFDKVQMMLQRGVKSSNNTGEVNMFAGLLYCADCGHALIKKTNHNPDKTYVYYRCSTHLRCKSACAAHTVRYEKLYRTVLTAIQKMVDLAVNADEVLREMKSRESADMKVSLISRLESQERELMRVKELLAGLYPDLKSGILSTEQYMMNKERLEKQQKKIEESIVSLKELLSDRERKDQSNDFIEHFKLHGNIDRLARPLLIELIDRISVSADGSLDIAFNFRDAFCEAQQLIERRDSA